MMLTAQRKHLETPAGICAQAGIDPVANLVAAWDWRGATEAARLKDKRYAGYNGTNNGATINDGEAVLVSSNRLVLGAFDHAQYFSALVAVAVTSTDATYGGLFLGNTYMLYASPVRKGWGIYEKNGDLYARFYGTEEQSYLCSKEWGGVGDGNMHCLIMVIDGDIISLYDNGSLFCSSVVDWTKNNGFSSYDVVIGKDPSNALQKWNGQCYSACIFNTALTPTQISKLHTILSARYE